MYYFTSINAYYIAKAKILASSIKETDKNAKFILVLSDDLPDNINLDNEPFDDIIFTDQIDEFNKGTFFKYNITELCTAVKPYSAKYIMEKYNADSICYLDPDIKVYSELIELKEILKTYSIVVTPHNTVPEEKHDFIVGNEILFLKRGTYNFGFFAVKNDEEGIKFLDWWHSRLKKYCVDDKKTVPALTEQTGYVGCFTDQKWADLIPSFFDNYYVLKHPGYNLSTWNITTKNIEYKYGEYLINDKPLRFFHFSGFDSRLHHYVLNMICNHYPHLEIVKNLSKEYEELHDKSISQDNLKEWKYARFSNGEKIDDEYRRIYLIREDAQNYFTNPFDNESEHNFMIWANTEYGNMLFGSEIDLSEQILVKTRHIKYHIDIKNICNNKIEITGWAFYKKGNVSGQVYIGLKNDLGKEHFFKANTTYRHDVAEHFKISTLIKSGFSLYMDVNEKMKMSSIIIEINKTYYYKTIKNKIF